MQVTVKLFATFREGRFKVETWKVTDPFSVGQLVAALQIPVESLGVVLVNGRHVGLEHFLNEKDMCAVFPKIGGG